MGTGVEEEGKDDVQRWTTKRKVVLVLSIVKGETSIQEAARQHGLTVAEIEDRKERFFLGAENALRARPKDDEALHEEQVKKLKQKDRGLGHGHRHPAGGGQAPPSDAGGVRAVKQAIPGSSVRRICRVLEVNRSSLSAAKGSRVSPRGNLMVAFYTLRGGIRLSQEGLN